MDLRLDDDDRRREVLRRLFRFLDRERGMPAGRRHPEVAQYRFGLVLVDVHRDSPRGPEGGRRPATYLPWPRLGAIVMQASTSDFTAATDLSNIARSVPFNWISTMRSTPLAAITVGTPTYRPLIPYSPLRRAAQGNTRFLARR